MPAATHPLDLARVLQDVHEVAEELDAEGVQASMQGAPSFRLDASVGALVRSLRNDEPALTDALVRDSMLASLLKAPATRSQTIKALKDEQVPESVVFALVARHRPTSNPEHGGLPGQQVDGVTSLDGATASREGASVEVNSIDQAHVGPEGAAPVPDNGAEVKAKLIY
jgi:hypothetical protein